MTDRRSWFTNHIKDNSGDETMTKMIILVSVFIVLAIIFVFVYHGWKDVIAEWLRTGLESIPNLE